MRPRHQQFLRWYRGFYILQPRWEWEAIERHFPSLMTAQSSIECVSIEDIFRTTRSQNFILLGPFSEKDCVYQNEEVNRENNNKRFRHTGNYRAMGWGWKQGCKIKIAWCAGQYYINHAVEILQYCEKPCAESEQWANKNL